jgi:tetratricopeptide (TPR) repeat protein
MRDTPYALLRNVFSWQFKIQDSDCIHLVTEKLEGGFGEIFGTDEDGKVRAHIVGQLLGFDFSTSPYVQGVLEDGQQLRERGLVYLGEYFQGIAGQTPLVMLLEDIHWADDSSLDAINRLALSNPRQRLLIVCVGRQVLLERRAHWGEGQVCHSRMTLKPLTKRESRQLVGEILKRVEDVPLYLREMIVDGAEGNPYYIEELIKMLIENGVILKGAERWEIAHAKLPGLDVPATLTGVLQARVDSLPGEEREILQQACVVGRVFWEDAIRYINATLAEEKQKTPTQVDQILTSVYQRGLINQRETSAFAGTVEYRFKNTIMQEVLYQGILKKVRQAYHGLVAEWLGERSGERTGEFMGMLADHLAASGQRTQAAVYLRKAGEQAARQYANQEALDYFSRALELTPEENTQDRFDILMLRVQVFSLIGERQSEEKDLAALAQLAEGLEDDQKRGELALLQAFHARETSNYPVIIAKAQEAIRLGNLNDVPRLEARGYLLWGRALLSQGDHHQAGEKFGAALTLARSEGLPQIEADSLRNLGIVRERSGDQSGAIESFEHALEIYSSIGDRRGEGRALNRLGNILLRSGDLSKGMAYVDQFSKICKEIGDRWGQGLVVQLRGDASLIQSDFREASAFYEEALKVSQQLLNRTMETDALIGLGLISLDRSEYENAQIQFERSLRVAHTFGNKLMEGKALMHIGRVFHHLGDNLRARSYYEQALNVYHQTDNRSGQGQVAAYLSLLAHHLGDNGAAKETCQQALQVFEAAQSQSQRQYRAFALIVFGHICRALGLTAEAKAAYQESVILRNEGEQINLAVESRAGLANVFLDESSLDLAVEQVDEILQHLGSGTLEGTEEPARITLTCYQVLQANRDPRALKVLREAYEQLQAQATKIEDEELRHSFLHNVAANRGIVSEFETTLSIDSPS